MPGISTEKAPDDNPRLLAKILLLKYCYGIIPENIPLHGPTFPVKDTQRANPKNDLPRSSGSKVIA